MISLTEFLTGGVTGASVTGGEVTESKTANTKSSWSLYDPDVQELSKRAKINGCFVEMNFQLGSTSLA
eukprot:CCRYP_016770-RF/>CCRYP_016770-RF protein AED:0.10 eAED:0.10 QI:3806/0.8/1/1/0/0.16/6/4495/67